MNTKPTVIEGWMEHLVPLDNLSGRSLFHPGTEKPQRTYGMDYTKVAVVIGDKAVPLSVVVEKANDALSALRPLRSLCRTNCADDEDEGHLEEVERILKALITL